MIGRNSDKQDFSAVVEVIPLAGFNAQLAYKVPTFIQSHLALGQLVRIPLRNKNTLGVVVQLGSNQELESNKLKIF